MASEQAAEQLVVGRFAALTEGVELDNTVEERPVVYTTTAEDPREWLVIFSEVDWQLTKKCTLHSPRSRLVPRRPRLLPMRYAGPTGET